MNNMLIFIFNGNDVSVFHRNREYNEKATFDARKNGAMVDFIIDYCSSHLVEIDRSVNSIDVQDPETLNRLAAWIIYLK